MTDRLFLLIFSIFFFFSPTFFCASQWQSLLMLTKIPVTWNVREVITFEKKLPKVGNNNFCFSLYNLLIIMTLSYIVKLLSTKSSISSIKKGCSKCCI